jgi:trehalose synthase
MLKALQVLNDITGFLVDSPEVAAKRLWQLLDDPQLCRRLGENVRIHVRNNFLLTRHPKDYLLTVLGLEHAANNVLQL